jgi:hypothetical protein
MQFRAHAELILMQSGPTESTKTFTPEVVLGHHDAPDYKARQHRSYA